MSIIQLVIGKFEISKHVDCYILCLKIIQSILHKKDIQMDTHILISILIQCLTAMSDNIKSLSDQDKEIYYQEVKKLVRLIHCNYQARLAASKPSLNQQVVSSASKDDTMNKINGKFQELGFDSSK